MLKLFILLNINFFFFDLPPDTPMLDLSKIAGMDLSKLPGVEQSGERCIRNIQEWLLHEVSSSETTILPEDKLQRILVGVHKIFFYYKLDFVNFCRILSHELEFAIKNFCLMSFRHVTNWKSLPMWRKGPQDAPRCFANA